MLLNDDTLVKSYALNRLVEFLEQHPTIGSVGAKVVNPDGSVQRSSARKHKSWWGAICAFSPLSSRFPNSKLFNTDFHLDYEYDNPREIQVPSEAAWVIRREVIETVGYFDEDYFIDCEGTDYGWRMAKHGWKTYVVPDAEIVHFHGVTKRRVRVATTLGAMNSNYRYLGKRYGKMGAWLYSLVVLLVSAIRLLIVFVTKRLSTDDENITLRMIEMRWALGAILGNPLPTPPT